MSGCLESWSPQRAAGEGFNQREERRPTGHGASDLPKRPERIDVYGPPGGKVAGKEGYSGEDDSRSRDADRVR